MRIRAAFPTLSVLIIILAVALFGHGWGQALPFATGIPNADYLSAPVAADISLRPDVMRLVAAQSGDDLETSVPMLPASPALHWRSASADRGLSVSNSLPRNLSYRAHAPRAPPFT